LSAAMKSRAAIRSSSVSRDAYHFIV
jgi:hypothetical protein